MGQCVEVRAGGCLCVLVRTCLYLYMSVRAGTAGVHAGAYALKCPEATRDPQ